MTTDTEECPICHTMHHGLLYHVFVKHLERKTAALSRFEVRRCFCNLVEFVEAGDFPRFKKHLEEKGGLLPHVIASGLGVGDG